MATGAAPVNFAGQSLYVPGAYSQRNMSAGDAGDISFSTLCLLGQCAGGIPYSASAEYPNPSDRINWVSTSQDCLNILRSGPGYYGALFALTASNDPKVGIPQRVGFIRTNPATKSMRIVPSDTGNCIDIKSLDYGTWTNQIQTQIQDATGVNAGTKFYPKKLTVQYGSVVKTEDNVGYSLFSMRYTGGGTVTSILLDPAVNFTIAGTGTGTTTALTAGLVLSNYITVGALVSYLQALTDWTVVLLGDPTFPLNQMDKLVIGDAAHTIVTANPYIFQANLQACIDWFNTKGIYTMASYAWSGTVRRPPTNDAALVSLGATAATTQTGTTATGSFTITSVASTTGINQGMSVTGTGIGGGAVVVSVVTNTSVTVSVACTAVGTVSLTYSQSGNEGGTPTQTDYQNALNNICAYNSIQLLGVMTGNAAVQSALATHCTNMSGIVGRMERQFIVGSTWGDSYATKAAQAAALNNTLGSFVSVGTTRYDINGVVQNYDGFYTAAMLLGMTAGSPITTPLTNKTLNILGTEIGLSTADKTNHITAGMIAVAKSDVGGFRVVRGVTTYQGQNKIFNEFSAMRTALFVTVDHRNWVESAIGIAGSTSALENIKNRAQGRLEYYVENGYLVVDPAFGNAYRNFTFTVIGDTVQISYEGTLVLPVNFILTVHNFVFIGYKK
jgi:hypothetical protein